MKTFIFLALIIALTGTAYSQITFSKNEVIDMTIESLEEELCAGFLLECLDISKASCVDDVKKILTSGSDEGSCHGHIPDEDLEMDSIVELTVTASKCVVGKLFKKHNDALMKNINSEACEALLND